MKWAKPWPLKLVDLPIKWVDFPVRYPLVMSNIAIENGDL